MIATAHTATREVDVLGIKCLVADGLEGAAQRVIELVMRGDGGYVSTCNVHVVVTACREREYNSTLSSAALRVADGWPVAWMQRRQGAESARRIPGPDLMERLFDRGRAQGLSHYLLGSAPSVLEKLESEATARFPGVRIAGTHSPPFRDLDSRADNGLVERIRLTSPDVVWVGLGAPKQDQWMQLYAERLRPSVLIGVGAAFEFIAGTRPRAPEWMRSCGLEWIHRIASEPRRLTPRYVSTNTEFILRAGSALIRQGSGK